MKSSRQRFREFREKVRKGLLEPTRYRDPNDKREIPANFGGGGRWHGGADAAAGKYEFKHPRKQLLAEYRIMLKGYYGPVAVLLLLGTLGMLLSLIMPMAIQLVVDYIGHGLSLQNAPLVHRLGLESLIPADPYHSLYVLVAVLIVAALLNIGLDWLRLLASQRLNFRLAGTLRQRLHNHLMRLSLSQLADYKTGGIVSRIMGDSEQVVGGVQNAILNPFNALIRVLGILFLLIWINWRLSLAAASLIPPIVLIHFLLFRRLRPMWRNIRDDNALLAARLTDLFGGIRVVRSFRRERSEAKEFSAAQDTMIRKQQFTAVLGRFLGTGWSLFGPAIGIVILCYGGVQVLHGIDTHDPKALTMGSVIMFQLYIFQIIGPITQMIESMQQLQANLGALDRVVDVLQQPTDMPDHPLAQALPNPRGEITLRNVTFGYVQDKPVIKNLSLQIPAGATVAIVGPSGSGKTTLINLIARFFDIEGAPSSNGDGAAAAICLDGIDIRLLKRDPYRKLFAMVLQDVYLFDGTVADNIAYGRRHAAREQIMHAARQANAHEFIMEMAENYDTLIGERGSKLSGGQKQRLSIARAILADPKILILDEATSSLDTHSEHLIQHSLRQLMVHRTTLVIAHRLSTIMHADRIVVLVDGQIVEQGTHEELLALGGTYHAMFMQQFERHRDPELERIEWQSPEPLAATKP